MTLRSWLLCALASLAALHATATDDARFAAKLALPGGQTAVVAEGDFEPRSIGSYSVRLYAAGVPDQTDTASFVIGFFAKRDGAIESVRLADIDRDGHDEIIVVMRSVGTGGYLIAHAITVREKRLEMRATVVGLPKDADPVAALMAVTAKEADPSRGPSKRP